MIEGENGRMFWKKIGHEFDEEAEMLLKDYHRCEERIYLYGAGLKGSQVYLALRRYGCFAGFIDSNKNKQLNGYLGERVLSFKEYCEEEGKRGWIVITASSENESIIERILQDSGLRHQKEYFFCEEMLNYYFPIIGAYYYDSCFLALCQICLTERCTLRCEKCAHGCYNVPQNSQDLSWEEFCLSVETFFSKVDYINEFVLIGGEPLLYKRLADAISYIGERYRNQIGTFSITTNATIIPSQEILEASRRHSVRYVISDYSGELPKLKDQLKTLTDTLKESHITYWLSKMEQNWLDYGFETVDHTCSDNEMTEFFDKCKTPCREIRGNRFYYCVMARSVSDNLGFYIGKEDYLDFDGLKDGYKKIILEYNLGYSKKGYLDMCRHCNGSDKINIYKIIAAKQIR